MTRAYDPSGSVLDALRTDLRDGVLPPGSPIVVIDLAKSHRVSATPVREALSRLSGEGLVEDNRGRGFSAPRLDADYISSLHQLHGAYINVALVWRGQRDGPVPRLGRRRSADTEILPAHGHHQRAMTEHLWGGVIDAVDNRALERHQQQVRDQLAVVRLVEPQIFADVAAELEHLADLATNGPPSVFNDAAMDYHKRRCEAANRLAHCIRDTFRV